MEINQLIVKLNSMNEPKTFRKLSDLEIGGYYIITDVQGINTKYGHKTYLELDSKFKIILPNKYSKLLNWSDDREKMIGLWVIYKGTKEINGCNKTHDIEFRNE